MFIPTPNFSRVLLLVAHQLETALPFFGFSRCSKSHPDRIARLLRVLTLSLTISSTLVTACATPTTKRVILEFDGKRYVVETEAATVEQILHEQNVPVGEYDRVDPPLYAEVARSATIAITRVQVRTDTSRVPIAFTRKLVRDEFYPDGQLRLIQLGVNGESEVIYTITFEQGQETGRRETSRTVLLPARDEILAIGTQGSIPTVPISGTIAYLANGNAWAMRQTNANKRALTHTGDLDGRVFSLSADGRYLLFSRGADENSNSLNSLWLMDTLVLDESARPLGVNEVLSAQLAPDGRTLAYSTGEKTFGAPGWKAHNDLWLASELTATQIVKQQIWKPSIPSPYSWWGGSFQWSPDGRALAYAFASEIGVVDLGNKPIAAGEYILSRQTIRKFPPFVTHADWVWTPQVSWSPDSRFIVVVVHARMDPPNLANDNPAFEVWAFSRDGAVAAPLQKQTGMWSAPVWSGWDDRRESRIAFGIALSPSDSERSRYALYAMDRDGGNKTQIFPLANENGLTVVQVAWSPNARQLLALREGDVWLYDFASSRWVQLTANAASAQPRWGK